LTPATTPTLRQEATVVITPAGQQGQTHEQIIAGERDRLLQIRTLAGPSRDEVPAELVTRAENEGWSVERASSEFLKHMRANRTPRLGNDAPAGIVRQQGPRLHAQLDGPGDGDPQRRQRREAGPSATASSRRRRTTSPARRTATAT
jgi:hypothetical protein